MKISLSLLTNFIKTIIFKHIFLFNEELRLNFGFCNY